MDTVNTTTKTNQSGKRSITAHVEVCGFLRWGESGSSRGGVTAGHETDLPEDEVLSDDGPHGLVAPHVPVQTLAGEVLHVLDVDHQPLVLQLPAVFRLKHQRHITDT